MFCPKCGKENSEENQFCCKCGTDLKTVKTARSKKLNKWDIIIVTFIAIVLIGTIVFGFFGKDIIGNSSLHVGNTQGTDFFGALKVEFQIYNDGNAAAKNVGATVSLYENEGNSTPIESKNVFIGTLEPGNSKTMSTTFYGVYPSTLRYKVFPWTRS